MSTNGSASVHTSNLEGRYHTMLEVTRAEDFLNAEFPQHTVIGEDVLDAQGLMLITGPTEAGKTYFVQQLSNELANGGPWLGRFSVDHPVRVLLLQGEIGERRFQQRLAKLPHLSPNLYVGTDYGLKLDEKSAIRQLSNVIEEHGIEVVIIDPLRPFFGGDENSSTDMNRLYSGVRRLQGQYNFAAVFTHHERKPTIMSKGDKTEARGTTVLTDRPDTILRLAPTKEGRKLTFEKVRNNEDGDKPGPFILIQSPVTTLFSVVDDGGPVIPVSLVTSMVGGGVLFIDLKKELANALSISEKAVERRVNGLVVGGVLEKGIHPDDSRQRVVRVVERYGQDKG